jgi:hypothetical protein
MTTLYDKTMRALEGALHCELLASALDFDRGVLPVGAHDDQILEYAIVNAFTRVPMFSREESGQKLVTDVAIVDLNRESVKSRRGVAVEEIIAGSAPISAAIYLLSRRPFYFVLQAARIRQILTVSDLNRLPVRTYLHVLLDHLESLLAERVETAHPSNSWIGLLSDQRQRQIRQLHEQKRSQDFDNRLIHCTTLSDKATVIGKSAELLAALSFESRSAFESRFQDVGRLRNRVLHGLPPLDKEADTLRDQISHGGLVTKRADLQWLQRVVGLMQQWIDAMSPITDNS